MLTENHPIKLPEKTVDCSGNPLDNRPVMDAAMEMYFTIQAERPDAKIAFVCGEEHKIPSHLLIQPHLIARLRKEGLNPTYAVEGEHDALKTIIEKADHLTVSKYDLEQMKRDDPEGQMLLKTLIGDNRASQHVFATIDSINYWLLRENIPVKFIDAAKRFDEEWGVHFIDDQDPLTSQFVSGEVVAGGSKGVGIRNQFMAAQLDGEDLVVAGVGFVHNLGVKESKYLMFDEAPYTESLTPALQERGFHVINIFPSLRAYGEECVPEVLIPDDADRSNLIIVEGLDARINQYQVDSMMEAFEYTWPNIKESGGVMDGQIAPDLVKLAMKEEVLEWASGYISEPETA